MSPADPGGRDPSRGPDALQDARRVLDIEIQALLAVRERLGEELVRAVDLLSNVEGRVVLSGVGKSGIIARKIAATLTSTGTPATFLHPVEGMHGDLGIVGRQDAAILVSKSGATEELHGLLDYLVRFGVPVVALSAPGSPLAAHAAVVLDCTVLEEACPFDLAPTSSTTATLALGDALAVALLRRKGFGEADFARYHPGGRLGQRLHVKVGDVMVSEGYPSLGVDARMRDAIAPLAEMRGTVPILDGERRVVGVVTAGDLTRLMEREPDFLDVPVARVMTRSPKVAGVDHLGARAARTMQEHGVMALPVVDGERRIEGVVHLHDLMKAGVL